MVNIYFISIILLVKGIFNDDLYTSELMIKTVHRAEREGNLCLVGN